MKHKPEEYLNIEAFYGGIGGTELDMEKARLVQQKASQENQPLDVVYFDEQFNCWRNYDWLGPVTRPDVDLWKACFPQGMKHATTIVAGTPG